jgi:hypothetical protein
VVIWEHRQQIAKLTAQMLRTGRIPPPLREGVEDFFQKFTLDHREAQQKYGEN